MELGRTDFHLRRVARAREHEETPNWSPQNMWCFSVVFRVATCEFEIAKTGRRSISKDGIGRSHQDLAIRSLGSRVNAAFAQNTAVHNLEVWFCKILARSNCTCGQRWGLLEQIFTSVVLRAWERKETPNWSPPEYVVPFGGISHGNV